MTARLNLGARHSSTRVGVPSWSSTSRETSRTLKLALHCAPANPATKRPSVPLMKQARAFGVGALLATQNAMTIDYRAHEPSLASVEALRGPMTKVEIQRGGGAAL